MLASYDPFIYYLRMDTYTLNLLGAFAVGFSDLQDSAMAGAGLPRAELAALLAVYTRPGSTVQDIAATTGLTHSGAVRVIDRLGDARLVERRTGNDRRTVAIHCTTEGRKKAKLALSLRQAALEEAAMGLSKGELVAFRGLARKLLSRLPDDRPDAWRVCRLCDHGVCQGASCPVGSAVP